MNLELTKEQIQVLRDTFDSIDLSKSGKINRSEIFGLFRSLNRNITKEEIDKFMAASDLDKDGAISFDEYVKLMNQYRVDKEKEIRRLFDEFDKNKNGAIERKEIYDVLRMLGENVRPTEVDVILETYDKNGQGSIDINEFIQLYKDLGF